MGITKSGYVVGLPLGLWSSINFDFIEVDGQIERIEVHLVDESGSFDIPPNLDGLAKAYAKTWLAESDEYGSTFYPEAWVGSDFWSAQTQARLISLAEAGAAERKVAPSAA